MFSYNGILPPQPGEVTLLAEAVRAIRETPSDFQGLDIRQAEAINSNHIRTLGFIASSDLYANGAGLGTIMAIAPDLLEQLAMEKVDQRKRERFINSMLSHANRLAQDRAPRQGVAV
jgi:hypothetical protein